MTKLQVFISSTFKDLQEERQAAVEAILSAGHIPAGMELFKAGNDSQLDVIKRWIDESDVYMLILGGRYGSIEPKSKKSYTHLEYEYAIEKGIPVFAVVMNKSALDEKVKVMSSDALETDYPDKYKKFKDQATSRMSSFFDDTKDIKLAIHESLQELQRLNTFTGWVSGKDVPDVSGLNQEIDDLKAEVMRLMGENQKLKEGNKELVKQPQPNVYNGFTYDEVKQLLENETVSFMGETLDLKHCFINYASDFSTGVISMSSLPSGKFLFDTASRYIAYGLTEKYNKVGSFYELRTSKLGRKFLAQLLAEEKSKHQEIAATKEE